MGCEYWTSLEYDAGNIYMISVKPLVSVTDFLNQLGSYHLHKEYVAIVCKDVHCGLQDLSTE
jgi:hypothetical protein